ncbi:hypothetical protein D3D03_15215 [Exiguobacterium sp. RIT452]|uniref:hypothetical protein n=1 Tax=Exiguobacterium TaxID=33986 RepID=UPI00068273B8|nr:MULTISPECIES: hypothetical protein [Exiguobacterium]KNH32474.1 hypothetical protein ACS74_14360 [Exiguobacterium acetylicum]RJO95606.1 hypothetical protein D3D03_15215 [Exiguobacterium sp. RIT452]
MPKVISTSLSQFSKDKVDLDASRLSIARTSTKALVDKIEKFEDSDDSFPAIYKDENYVRMGSFARRTKIRPLDDIDFLIVFQANSSTYLEKSNGVCEIKVPTTSISLYNLTNDDGTLNSIKLLNKLIKSLQSVPNHSLATIKRNQEAATFKFSSYEWNFDIVPAFITSKDIYGNSFYLIPDGNGKWKKTNPRIDSARATEINQKRDGKVLRIIRLIKKWHSQQHVPNVGSYLLENMILNHYEYNEVGSTDQIALRDLFNVLSSSIYSPCLDPKGIQGDLNHHSFETQKRFSAAAYKAYERSSLAIQYFLENKHKLSHQEWQKIFGSDFPDYE